MTEQPLDLEGSARALWRRRRTVGALAAIGLSAGIAYGVLQPHTPNATALVLLPPSPVTSNGEQPRDMTTQVVIATSASVLSDAGKAVSPPMTVSQVRHAVSVKGVSDQILQIKASAPRAHDAQVLANSVARDYIAFAGSLRGASSGPIQVLEAATGAQSPSKLRVPMFGAIGLVIGLAVGALLALVRSSRDRRLRYRDEIAGAISVPVLASLEAGRYTQVSQWEKLLECYQPSSVVGWALRRVLHRLGPAGGVAQEIRVMSFTDDRAAVAAGPQLAAFSARLGIPTVLDPSDEKVLAPLCAATDKRNGKLPSLLPSPGRAQPPPARAPSPGDDTVAGGERAELTVTVATVDRADPQVAATGGATVLAVSAGFATAEDLARLAMAAADAVQAIDGIFVVNPDSRDTTTGVVPETDVPQPIPLRWNGHAVPEAPSVRHPE